MVVFVLRPSIDFVSRLVYTITFADTAIAQKGAGYDQRRNRIGS